MSFGRYQIITELKRGGMATVYHAHDPRFKRDVAIKVLPREFLHDPMFKTRFEQEAQVIAGLNHPAVVQVYDFGEEGGIPFLVMQYMQGGSLADRIRAAQGPVPLNQIIPMFERITPALENAHSRGIIHRDLKPDNILFDSFGFAYVSDFGIVKMTEDSAHMTGTGQMIGTPAYMAPEMSKENGVTPLVDVYALGVTFFELMTGRRPYNASTPVGLMTAHIVEPIPDVRDYNQYLSDEVQDLIQIALAKDPAERFQSVTALTEAVMALPAQEVADADDSPITRQVPADRVLTPPVDEAIAVPLITAYDPAPEKSKSRGLPRWAALGGLGAFLLIGLIAIAGVLGRNLIGAGTTFDAENAKSEDTSTSEAAVPTDPPTLDNTATSEAVETATEETALSLADASGTAAADMISEGQWCVYEITTNDQTVRDIVTLYQPDGDPELYREGVYAAESGLLWSQVWTNAWEDVPLPQGALLALGFVTSQTDCNEHQGQLAALVTPGPLDSSGSSGGTSGGGSTGGACPPGTYAAGNNCWTSGDEVEECPADGCAGFCRSAYGSFVTDYVCEEVYEEALAICYCALPTY